MSTIDQQAMAWMLRAERGTLDDAEQQAFDAWFGADIRHQGAFLRATAINNALSRATVQESLRPAPERLRTEWAGGSWRQAPPRRAWLAAGALAAGAAFFSLGTWFTAAPAPTVLATALGEVRRVPLADHSVASINSDSVVEVRLDPASRQVALQRGEAWFEVAKDKARPFVVAAGDATVRAVGTAFGVRRLTGGAEVLVTEGTVEITGAAGTGRQLLAAGQSAFIPVRGGAIAVASGPDDIARRLAWREGKLVFKDQKLADAVADFNRYSLKKIVIDDPRLAARTLVGQYQIDAPELFARDVGTFLDVPVRITADRIAIGAVPTVVR
jgi:transmembrane sensor